MKIFNNVPCTLVIGFLGSGKTTIINYLLQNKPQQDTWGLLINEFGKIGIDSTLINNTDNQKIAIKEVSGGCICCTSQLPLQISLSRLLSENNPKQLIIEPTGLAHPEQLIEQLSAPHWQSSLGMRTVICTLNAHQWLDARYNEHDGYQSHVQYADVIIINRFDALSTQQKQQLQNWIYTHNPQASILWHHQITDTSNVTDIVKNSFFTSNHPSNDDKNLPVDLKQLLQNTSNVVARYQQKDNQTIVPLSTSTNTSFTVNTNKLSPSLNRSNLLDDTTQTTAPNLPFRYHEVIDGIPVGGWQFEANNTFSHDKMLDWLLKIPNWQRIKGTIKTDQGWIKINFTLDSTTTSACPAQLDNRLEIILRPETDNKSSQTDWGLLDKQLIALKVV